MNSTTNGVREVLRALAEVRDGAFYSLWVDLSGRVGKPRPDIGFRIYQVANTPEALAVVWVHAAAPDGRNVSWNVAVQTSGEELQVTAEVSVDEDLGAREVFTVSDRSTDPARTSELIHAFAREVCARRECF